MKTLIAAAVALLIVTAIPAWAEPGIRQERAQLDSRGAATVSGRVKGYTSVDYTVTGKAGQALTVVFSPNRRSAFFNVLPPGSEQALFIGSTSGNRYAAWLPADGEYTVRVYLMRNAARRNESAKYSLALALEDAGPVAAFERTLELQGIRFHVTSAHRGSLNTLRIEPAGLEIDNAPQERTLDGTVTGAEVADLNADGSPEIYVYVTSAGRGSYGSLVAFAANRRKSLSEIFLTPLEDSRAATKGYRGHDEFAVLEGVLGRRFPLYREGDSNGKPSGRMRQIQYKLFPGEAGWILKVDRVVEF